MSKLVVHPWIEAYGYMNDTYKAVVVDTALRHLAQGASKELQLFAKNELTKLTKVKGFRSAYEARSRPILICPYILTNVQSNNSLATLIIYLWAEARHETITYLLDSARGAGFQFHSDWSWKDAKDGFLDFEDTHAFFELASSLAQAKPSPESDHLLLACLWLSRALIDEKSENDLIPNIGDDPEIGIQPSPVQELANPDSNSTEQEAGSFMKSPNEDGLQVTGVLDISEEEQAQEPVSVLVAKLQTTIAEYSKIPEMAIKYTQALLTAIEASRIKEAEALITELQLNLAEWKRKGTQLEGELQQVKRYLISEIAIRPDIDPDQSLSIALREPIDCGVESDLVSEAQHVLIIFEQIVEYDQEKQAVLVELKEVQTEIVRLQAEVAEWIDHQVPEIKVSLLIGDNPTEETLAALQSLLKEAKIEQGGFRDQLVQLKETNLSRVTTLITFGAS